MVIENFSYLLKHKLLKFIETYFKDMRIIRHYCDIFGEAHV